MRYEDEREAHLLTSTTTTQLCSSYLSCLTLARRSKQPRSRSQDSKVRHTKSRGQRHPNVEATSWTTQQEVIDLPIAGARVRNARARHASQNSKRAPLFHHVQHLSSPSKHHHHSPILDSTHTHTHITITLAHSSACKHTHTLTRARSLGSTNCTQHTPSRARATSTQHFTHPPSTRAHARIHARR